MKNLFSVLSLALVSMLLLASCEFEYNYYTKDQQAQLSALNMPALPISYTVEIPNHLQNTGLFARPVDNEKAALGRVIFYDKSLSSDGKVSCASCHLQDHGFADPKVLSVGVNDRQSGRNSIALGSVVNFSAYYGEDINGPTAIRFFWDNRAGTVTEQSRGAFTNPDEMNLQMHDVLDIVRSKDYYKPLFQKAFGIDDVSPAEINEANLFAAVSDFINSMGSYDSRFDNAADELYKNNDVFGDLISTNNLPGLTSEENAGKNLYISKCANCHSVNMGRPVLNYANNGLDLVYSDHGVGAITNNPQERDQFKVPTLRNIEVSAPYMHDGRFATLEEVIDHYSTGIKKSAGLHAFLRDGNDKPVAMNFTAVEKKQLIAFLKTVTDHGLKTDERFSDPFK
jgi:cytochrome c peroxidase